MLDDCFLEIPILRTLEEYLSKKPARMHVPFHAGIPNNDTLPKEIYNLDISEVSGYDVEGEDNPICQSEKITADFFSVKHSFYLTGGASIGLIASLIALRKFGKKVILARNVHKSVINGVILAGLNPIWLDVDFLDNWGIFSIVDLNKLDKVTSCEENIAGCVIVSPTYEGIISNVRDIATMCHKKNIPLIVDEAHGAHFYFLNNKGLISAIQLEADLVIQSWHKSLGSLTQSGVLHLVNESFFTYNDLKRSLDLVSSTSPSFLLLASLELTRKFLAETRGNFFNLLLNKAMSFRLGLEQIKDLYVLKNDDPFKVYLKMSNISGIDLAYKLYKNYSIEVESVNDIGLLMLIENNFTDEIKDKVIDALIEVSDKSTLLNVCIKETSNKPLLREIEIRPRDAFMSGYKNSSDINCEVKAPCPPGYVVNIPGVKK